MMLTEKKSLETRNEFVNDKLKAAEDELISLKFKLQQVENKAEKEKEKSDIEIKETKSEMNSIILKMLFEKQYQENHY